MIWKVTYESWARDDDDGVAAFGQQLQAFLQGQQVEVDRARCVVMLVLLQDGFDIVQIGDRPLSDGRLAYEVQRVGEHLLAQMAKLN
jgi:hypothetical protein